MPRVSAEHLESRRAEILCAARRRFAQNGFHATSMQDILDESGLSAGAVYRYFPGKSEIVAAIATENVAALVQTLGAFTDTTELGVADALITAVHKVREKHRNSPTAPLALQVWAESTGDPELRAGFATTHESFRSITADLIRRRHPERAADADAMAGVVATIVPGFLIQLSLLDPERTAQFEDGLRLVLGDL